MSLGWTSLRFPFFLQSGVTPGQIVFLKLKVVSRRWCQKWSCYFCSAFAPQLQRVWCYTDRWLQSPKDQGATARQVNLPHQTNMALNEDASPNTRMFILDWQIPCCHCKVFLWNFTQENSRVDNEVSRNTVMFYSLKRQVLIRWYIGLGLKKAFGFAYANSMYYSIWGAVPLSSLLCVLCECSLCRKDTFGDRSTCYTVWDLQNYAS